MLLNFIFRLYYVKSMSTTSFFVHISPRPESVWLLSFLPFCFSKFFSLALSPCACVSKIMGKHFEVVKDTCREKQRQSMERIFSETEVRQRGGLSESGAEWNAELLLHRIFSLPLSLPLLLICALPFGIGNNTVINNLTTHL